jgi:ABC-2 type transport system ATP-binding protein
MENLIDPIIILDDGKIIFQQPLQEASRRLSAEIEREEPRDPGVLYSEKTLGGWVVVREKKGGEEANIDLETLFNTVTTNRERVRALFEAVAQEAG